MRIKTSQTLFILLTIVTLHAFAYPEDLASRLSKRKGIGGSSGGRSGGATSGDSPGSSPGSSHPESGSAASARTARLGSADSNEGGETPGGTGVQPRTYANGHSYYYGGAEVPYRAGERSNGGIGATFFPAAGLTFFPGRWPYGAYAYPYTHPYTYHNSTSNQNETKPAECFCARYQECGCDQVQNNETAYMNHVANNRSMARLGTLDGVQTLLINGTLPNGTTVASAAPSFKQGLTEMNGLWVVVAGVLYTVCFF